MSLLQIRTLFGMTQAQIGELVGVSQQTVARWENSLSSEIPSRHLQDLALALGCRVDDLLRDKPALADRKAFSKGRSDEDRPYGTARLELSSARDGVRLLEYPISIAEAGRLRLRVDPDSMAPWLDLWAMDDRVLLIRADALAALELIHDDVEEMPEFEIREVYEALLDDRIQELLEADDLPAWVAEEDSPFSPTLIERCRSVATWWRGLGNRGDAMDPTRRIVVDFTNGRRHIADYCVDEAFGELQRLVEHLDEVRMLGTHANRLDNWMLDLDPEDSYRATFVRLGAVHSIQFSGIGHEHAVARLLGTD